jgi:hypothetical protein
MQCLQGWVVKTHPLQVHRITLHPRGYEVMQLMQLMQFGRPRRARSYLRCCLILWFERNSSPILPSTKRPTVQT